MDWCFTPIYNDYFVDNNDDDIINNNSNSNDDIINGVLVDKIKVERKENMKGAQEKNYWYKLYWSF